jgi:hypothetical protein
MWQRGTGKTGAYESTRTKAELIKMQIYVCCYQPYTGLAIGILFYGVVAYFYFCYNYLEKTGETGTGGK